MKIKWIAMLTAAAFNCMAGDPGSAQTTLERMPAELETRFALSAVPPQLRDGASVYLLDPAEGYTLSKQGTSGVACIVQRTVWELADFRNDIYIPLCYDAAGTRTYLLMRSLISRHSEFQRRPPARRASADIVALFQASGTQPEAVSEAPEGLASQRPWTSFSALDVVPATPARRRLATNAERQAECLLINDLISKSHHGCGCAARAGIEPG